MILQLKIKMFDYGSVRIKKEVWGKERIIVIARSDFSIYTPRFSECFGFEGLRAVLG